MTTMSHGFPKHTRRQRRKRAHDKKIELRPKPILEAPPLVDILSVLPSKKTPLVLAIEDIGKPTPLALAFAILR